MKEKIGLGVQNDGRGRGYVDSMKSTSFRTPPSSWVGPAAVEKAAGQSTVERELEKRRISNLDKRLRS